MLQKIKSQIVELPPIWLCESEDDFKQLPKGLPYIIANKRELPFIKLFLEFHILYKSCLRTNLPIKWLDCLKKLGYKPNMKQYKLNSGGNYWDSLNEPPVTITVEDFIEEEYFVNFDKLFELKIFPKWLDDLKSNIEVNIIDELLFNPMKKKKKLGLPIGHSEVKHNMKNLLILDCSKSIPTSIVKTITVMAKLMSKKFYADVIITCGKSFLVDYDDVENTDFVELAAYGGRSNESEMYSEIMKKEKEYNVCISFGDDDSPGIYTKECNFKIETLYSLHTDNDSYNITGYARQFKPKTTHIVYDWVNTINQ